MASNRLKAQYRTIESSTSSSPPYSNGCEKAPKSLAKAPWVALVLAVLVILCIASAITVTVLSVDNSAIDHQLAKNPSVLLAVISAVSNLSLSGLLGLGVVVTWWLCATHGTDLRNLHVIWNYGAGFYFKPASGWGWDTWKVILAALLVLFARLSSNPILQRAVEPETKDVITTYPLRIQVPKRLEDGWLGEHLDLGNGFANIATYPPLEIAFRDYFLNVTLHNTGYEELDVGGFVEMTDQRGFSCPLGSRCYLNVTAAGIGSDCSEEVESVNLLDPRNFMSEIPSDDSNSLNSTLFRLFLDIRNGTNPAELSLSMAHIESIDPDCTGIRMIQRCRLWPATITYPLIVNGTAVFVDYDNLPEVPQLVDNYTTPGDTLSQPASSNAGLMLSIHGIFARFLNTHVWMKGSNLKAKDENTLAYVFIEKDDSLANTSCNYLYNNPRLWSIWSMNEVILRTGFSAASEKHLQTVNSTNVMRTAVYKANYMFLVVGVTVMAAALISTLMLFWGWWHLERPVTLSPLETAKAFGSPMLLESDASRVDHILSVMGRKGVRYQDGQLVESRQSPVLATVDTELRELISSPEEGSRVPAL
ncbi:hypothetical protein K469DRAFT_755563 [Zopfia rhizophila CBS 207.26]|uniref:Uncharacterized protein n=1 Tax=Zopfia rhizophila CBS 207.26 TaxID=1314779 RepID=A0A6A6DEI2_9PEZI|nr:hypothetical protein K469DRAFT_755563 [Zopfia rhizophila CBS 207.26]